MGRFEEAIACFEQSISLDPCHTVAYFALMTSKKIGEADWPMIERILGLLDNPALNDRDRANLHFALGKAFDDLAAYETAMRHFDDSNRIEADRLRLIGRSFDRERHSAGADALIATFTPDYFAWHAAFGSDSELPNSRY